MKKIIVSSIVATALFGVASFAGASFMKDLSVGSTGADVSALQSWLISKGFSIPAISSGAAQPGYFGQQTKAAVVAYQKSVSLPSTGFVGPLTRGVLNGSPAVAGTPAPFVCPSWMTCTSNGTTPPVTTTPGVFAADGTDGSITLSSSSYVSSSQTLKKGDMDKPIISVTAKATAGNVNVTRFDIHFNSRPWLLFSGLTLKNTVTGQTLGTKSLNSLADVTEVTVGSDYLVRFEGISAVVTPGTDTTFVVNGNVLAASDKITGQTITVSTDANGIRTINGKGYTDSTGLTQTNSITLSSTGSTGDLNTKVSEQTPDTRTVNISTTNVTTDQVLGVFGVKLQNQSGSISQLSFNIKNSTGAATSTLFQNVRLYDGSVLLGGAYSLSAGSPTFVLSPAIPLAADVWKHLTLKADVQSSATAFSASSTLVSASVVGVDSNFNTITLTNASNRTSNDVTFVPNAGITVSNWVLSKGTVTTPTSGVWLNAYPTISFTITNTGNNPIYISKTSNTALGTTTSSGPNASTTVTSVSASGSTSGDTSTSYIINSSRTFTYNLFVDNTNGGGTSKKISVTQINYGTAGGLGTDNTLNVNYGLESAYVQVP